MTSPDRQINDLAAFLRARLDEDEHIAHAVEDRSAPWTGRWVNDHDTALRTYNGHVLAYLPGARPFKPGVLPHIVRHDPARVLRDVKATRQLLDDLLTDEHGMSQYDARFLCGAARDNYGNLLDPNDTANRTGACDCGRDERVYRRLCYLAQPRVDHPDYQEQWKP